MSALQEVWGCLCMFLLKLLSLIPVWAPSKAFLFNMISFHDRARRATLWEKRLNFNNLQIEKKNWDREKNRKKKKRANSRHQIKQKEVKRNWQPEIGEKRIVTDISGFPRQVSSPSLSLSSPHLATGPLGDSTPLLLVHPSSLEAAGIAPNWGYTEARRR